MKRKHCRFTNVVLMLFISIVIFGKGATNYEYISASKTYALSNNTNNLQKVQSTDTSNLVKINLYNYNKNINKKYDSNSLYPGFQQDYGSYNLISSTSKLGQYSYNFGNVIAADLQAGRTDITRNGNSLYKQTGTTNVNQTYYESLSDTSGDINHAIFGAISKKLINDYPALSNSTSLKDLFVNNGMSGAVTKVNTKNINGLFQTKKMASGALSYYFDCMENAAIFNANTNNFDLYNETITPNFIMYPFGNFLPFSKIEKDTTKTSSINRDYFVKVANSAASKSNQATMVNGSPYRTGYNEYTSLSTSLNRFVTLTDKEENKTTWTALDLIQNYYDKTSREVPQNIDLNNLYNIDYDEESDFLFGLDIEFSFMQPYQGKVGDSAKENMIFSFTGDDDVWVYLDGNLFVELTGIHRQIGSNIDFANGYVNYYAYVDLLGDVIFDSNKGTLYRSVSFDRLLSEAGYTKEQRAEMLDYKLDSNGNKIKASEKGMTDETYYEARLKDYSKHTLKFYYMERGSGSSVFRLNFNMPLVEDEYLDISKSVEGKTEDAVLKTELENIEYKFRTLKVNDNTVTNELFLTPDTSYQVFDNKGNLLKTKTIDENGFIYLKDGERARISGIKENRGKFVVEEVVVKELLDKYGDVKVMGSSTSYTSNKKEDFNNEYYDEKGNKYLQSDIRNMSDGAVGFDYTNTFKITLVGHLQIEKQIIETDTVKMTEEDKNKTFDFMVLLGSKDNPQKIGQGTVYEHIDASGNKTAKKIEQEGIVSLRHNEKAIFKNIEEGTYYTVYELEASSQNYSLGYQSDAFNYQNKYQATLENNSVHGLIRPSYQEAILEDVPTIKIIAQNKLVGTNLLIPFSKTLLTKNEGEYAYKFSLVQTTDASGSKILLATKQIEELNFTVGDTKASSFILNYRLDDEALRNVNYPHTIYYSLQEEITDDDYTAFDNAKYVIAVTLNKIVDEEVLLEGKVTALWKNGKEIALDSILTFENEITGSLEIKKIVNGSGGDKQKEWAFQIILKDEKGEEIKDSFAYIGSKEGTLTSGSIFTLKHDENIIIPYLKEGTSYEVIEIDANNHGYTTSSSMAKGVIVEREIKNVAFINTKEVNPHTYDNISTYLILAVIAIAIIFISYVCYRRLKH